MGLRPEERVLKSRQKEWLRNISKNKHRACQLGKCESKQLEASYTPANLSKINRTIDNNAGEDAGKSEPSFIAGEISNGSNHFAN